MHFWNKLSTAALMRLTILASLNLLLGRILGRWDVLLHPLFFLVLVTLNLGLYAVMVYTGTLNKTLIGMMLGGLVATLAAIAYFGIEPRTFLMQAGPSARVRWLVESLLTRSLDAVRDRNTPPRWRTPFLPSLVSGGTLVLIGYLAIDLVGLVVIAAAGWLARRLHADSRRCDATTAPPSS